MIILLLSVDQLLPLSAESVNDGTLQLFLVASCLSLRLNCQKLFGYICSSGVATLTLDWVEHYRPRCHSKCLSQLFDFSLETIHDAPRAFPRHFCILNCKV